MSGKALMNADNQNLMFYVQKPIDLYTKVSPTT